MTCRRIGCLLLVLLVGLATWGRWTSASSVFDPKVNRDKSLYLDEIVYIGLGQSLLSTGDYSFRRQYEKMTEIYSKVPVYLNDKLFKHPPLVPVMLGLTMKLFHNQIRYAYLPGMVLGVAMILLMAAAGRTLFRDRRVAWIAAVLLAVSPVHWICCAKIILSVPLSCFVLIAVVLQLWSVRRPSLLWLSAIAWALAWWTKYTAIPLWVVFQVAFFLCYPGLLRSRRWMSAQAGVLLMFLPWLIWRSSVEGVEALFFWQQGSEEWRAASRLVRSPAVWTGILAGVALVAWIAMYRRRILSELMCCRMSRKHGVVLAACSIVLLWLVWLVEPASLGFGTLPWHGEGSNRLAEASVTTYFWRLIQFEPITLLGMVFFIFLPAGRPVLVLKMLAVGGSLLLTAWGNYQMRYFLPVIPVWELLSAGVLVYFYDIIRQRSRPFALVFVAVWLSLSLSHSLWLDWRIAIPNDVFYF